MGRLQVLILNDHAEKYIKDFEKLIEDEGYILKFGGKRREYVSGNEWSRCEEALGRSSEGV